MASSKSPRAPKMAFSNPQDATDTRQNAEAQSQTQIAVSTVSRISKSDMSDAVGARTLGAHGRFQLMA